MNTEFTKFTKVFCHKKFSDIFEQGKWYEVQHENYESISIINPNSQYVPKFQKKSFHLFFYTEQEYRELRLNQLLNE